MSGGRGSRRALEPFDTLMYRGESDPRSRSTLTGLFVLDRMPDWQRLVVSYERITRLIPQLRERVVEPLLPITAPAWVIDPDFDLAYHLRRVRVPAPGTFEQLLELLEPMVMTPFDRARPLWELTLIEGLEQGGAAWVMKISHAIADGVGGQALAAEAFDAVRDPPPRDLPPRPAPYDVTPTDLTRDALTRAPLSLVEAAARGARTTTQQSWTAARRPLTSLTGAATYARSLRRVMAGPPGQPSPLLRSRGLRRRLLTLEVPKQRLRAGSKAAGGSLNDGYLAAVCGGLRSYHEQLGVSVSTVPVAVPISLRTADDPAGGNRWAGALLALPVGESDPIERIRDIRQQVLAARHEPAITALNLIAPVAARLPTWVLATAFSRGSMSPDIQVSNVPGSPTPMYIAGAEVTKMFPFGPAPGPAAMVTLNSYRESCFVGINLDPAAITQPDLFRTCLEEGLNEVMSLGDGVLSPRETPA
jgi:diacylglycerol O-acyltransferase